jgi:hypothetical protein
VDHVGSRVVHEDILIDGFEPQTRHGGGCGRPIVHALRKPRRVQTRRLHERSRNSRSVGPAAPNITEHNSFLSILGGITLKQSVPSHVAPAVLASFPAQTVFAQAAGSSIHAISPSNNGNADWVPFAVGGGAIVDKALGGF